MTSSTGPASAREIVPGAWSIRLALENPLLGHVCVYALELAGGGLVLIDCGWDDEDTFGRLEAALRTFGAAVEDVRGVAVTHFHPDHYGLVGAVRERSSAWVAIGAEEAARVAARRQPVAPLVDRAARWLRQAGVPDAEIPEMLAQGPYVRDFAPGAEPTVVVAPGDRIDAPGWELVALATPGHTAGHLAFLEPGRRLLFCGDHVLAGSVPSVPLHPESGASPMGEQIAALERTIALGPGITALAGHGRPIPNVATRARELVEEYERRLDRILRIVPAAETAWEVATRFPFGAPWESVTGFFRRTAVGEMLSGLVLLEERGAVVRVPGTPERWATA